MIILLIIESLAIIMEYAIMMEGRPWLDGVEDIYRNTRSKLGFHIDPSGRGWIGNTRLYTDTDILFDYLKKNFSPTAEKVYTIGSTHICLTDNPSVNPCQGSRLVSKVFIHVLKDQAVPSINLNGDPTNIKITNDLLNTIDQIRRDYPGATPSLDPSGFTGCTGHTHPHNR